MVIACATCALIFSSEMVEVFGIELLFSMQLEAFAVDDGRARLVVFLLRDPHLLERRQRGQDGATDPDRVFALGRSDDLDLHRRRRQRSDFLLHAVGDARVHGSATRQHRVGVEVLTDVHVALHDRVVGRLVDSARFHAQEGRLEQSLGAAETLVADRDDLAVGQLVRFLQRGRGGSRGHFLFEVQGDVAQLLLNIAHDFTFSCKTKTPLDYLGFARAQFSSQANVPVVVNE